jgi:hypothetical protein
MQHRKLTANSHTGVMDVSDSDIHVENIEMDQPDSPHLGDQELKATSDQITAASAVIPATRGHKQPLTSSMTSSQATSSQATSSSSTSSTSSTSTSTSSSSTSSVAIPRRVRTSFPTFQEWEEEKQSLRRDNEHLKELNQELLEQLDEMSAENKRLSQRLEENPKKHRERVAEHLAAREKELALAEENAQQAVDLATARQLKTKIAATKKYTKELLRANNKNDRDKVAQLLKGSDSTPHSRSHTRSPSGKRLSSPSPWLRSRSASRHRHKERSPSRSRRSRSLSRGRKRSHSHRRRRSRSRHDDQKNDHSEPKRVKSPRQDVKAALDKQIKEFDISDDTKKPLSLCDAFRQMAIMVTLKRAMQFNAADVEKIFCNLKLSRDGTPNEVVDACQFSTISYSAGNIIPHIHRDTNFDSLSGSEVDIYVEAWNLAFYKNLGKRMSNVVGSLVIDGINEKSETQRRLCEAIRQRTAQPEAKIGITQLTYGEVISMIKLAHSGVSSTLRPARPQYEPRFMASTDRVTPVFMSLSSDSHQPDRSESTYKHKIKRKNQEHTSSGAPLPDYPTTETEFYNLRLSKIDIYRMAKKRAEEFNKLETFFKRGRCTVSPKDVILPCSAPCKAIFRQELGHTQEQRKTCSALKSVLERRAKKPNPTSSSSAPSQVKSTSQYLQIPNQWEPATVRERKHLEPQCPNWNNGYCFRGCQNWHPRMSLLSDSFSRAGTLNTLTPPQSAGRVNITSPISQARRITTVHNPNSKTLLLINLARKTLKSNSGENFINKQKLNNNKTKEKFENKKFPLVNTVTLTSVSSLPCHTPPHPSHTLFLI